MTTNTIAPQIAAFAAAVRDALADLPADERDELIEGLEADLAEAYAEDLANTLPDPVEYAAELRRAAGLPEPRVDRGSLIDGLRRTGRDMMAVLHDNSAVSAVIDFGDALRPLWWVARAWIACWAVSVVFGGSGGVMLLLFAVGVVVSVQWGRGRWAFGALPVILVVGNVIAALLLIPMASYAASGNGSYDQYDSGFQDGYSSAVMEGDDRGLVFNGRALENVYAYDADGNLLRNVQLFDVRGNRLEPARMTEESEWELTPAALETGEQVFNVFPLSGVKLVWDDGASEQMPDPNPDSTTQKAFQDGPFVKVPAVDVPDEKVSENND